MLKAIETEYNGYRFRSRLEARWAVFFDTLEIEYQYEPEGFELKDGSRYLPDFYLPKVLKGSGCWVEIKPLTPKITGEVGEEIEGDLFSGAIAGFDKMLNLLDGIGQKGLIIYGQPYPDEHKIIYFNSDGEPDDYWQGFRMCLDRGHLVVGYDDCQRGFWNPFGSPDWTCYYCDNPASDKIHPFLMWAYTAARQARFGQNGRG